MGDLMKSRTRSRQMTRRVWRIRSRKLLVGWTQIKLLKRRSLRRSRRSWKELPCQSCKRWEVELVACQVECPEVCLEVCQEVECLIWVAWAVHHQPKIPLVDQQSKRLIKNFVSSSIV